MEILTLYGSCAEPEGNVGNPGAIEPIGNFFVQVGFVCLSKHTSLHSLQTSGSPQLLTASAAGNDQTSM